MIEAMAAMGGRVLVAQSYFLRFDSKLWEAAQPVPPLGSLICASVLRDKGFDVSFFDSMLAVSEDSCAEVMDRERPATLVLFEDNFNYLSKMCLDRMRQAAVRLIGLAKDRGICVVVAGSDASDHPEFFLRAGASAVAIGEGEFAVSDWLTQGPGPEGPIAGIATLSEDGAVLRGPARAPLGDLDTIPSPAWDLIDLRVYRQMWTRRNLPFTLPLATSRGCPFHCNWCAKPIWGQRYHALTPRRAAIEVESLKRLGAQRVNVLDDIFGLRPGWMEEFGLELRRLDARLPFRCLSRADLLTDRTVRALATAGCDMVWIGAESGSQAVLDAMEKGTTVHQIRAAALRLKAAGVKVGFFLQFGYPGETERDVEATLKLVDDALPDDIGISVSYPLPGTPFYTRVKGEMGRASHWHDSSDLAMLFAGRHGTRYYRHLHAYAHARFRLSRAARTNEHSVPRRLLHLLRYGAKRGVMAMALAFSAHERVEVRSLSPQLSREGAATPTATDLARPGEA